MTTTLRKILETATDTAVAALGLAGLCCVCSVEQAESCGTAAALLVAGTALMGAAVLLARTSAHGAGSRNYDDLEHGEKINPEAEAEKCEGGDL